MLGRLRRGLEALTTGVDPRRHPLERHAARSRVRRWLSTASSRSDDGGHHESAMFPVRWRGILASRPATEEPACVALDCDVPWAHGDALATDGVRLVHLCPRDLDANVTAGVLVLGVPAEWSTAARLVALVNTGLLERAPSIGILRADGAVVDPATAVRSLRDSQRLGILTATLASPTRPQRRAVARVLALLDVRVSCPSSQRPSSSFWARGFLIHGLRALNVTPDRLSQTLRREAGFDGLASLLAALAVEAGCVVATAPPGDRPFEGLRVVPFHLPQFHATPGNDEWWGRGFTEWTNVTGARPVYRGHEQPFLPADLGFYDLTHLPAQAAQQALAKRFGVAGFMYYFYWFAGRTELEAPVAAHTRAGGADPLPFCLMWANENWTRTWDGGTQHVLLAQDYESRPAEEFIIDVLPYLRDPAYLRVDGKAVLGVYRPSRIPAFEKVVDHWRAVAAAEDVELLVLAAEVGTIDGRASIGSGPGVDGTFAFPPLPFGDMSGRADISPRRVSPRFRGYLMSYQRLAADRIQLLEGLSGDRFPGVATGWDNTPRRQNESVVFAGANPYTFHRWLLAAVDAVIDRPREHRVVFVNAWNEWAEGAVMEPSRRFGTTFLAAVADVVDPGRRQATKLPSCRGPILHP